MLVRRQCLGAPRRCHRSRMPRSEAGSVPGQRCRYRAGARRAVARAAVDERRARRGRQQPPHGGGRTAVRRACRRRLRTLTKITLPCAKRAKPEKTGCAWMQLATLYRALSLAVKRLRQVGDQWNLVSDGSAHSPKPLEAGRSNRRPGGLGGPPRRSAVTVIGSHHGKATPSPEPLRGPRRRERRHVDRRLRW